MTQWLGYISTLAVTGALVAACGATVPVGKDQGDGAASDSGATGKDGATTACGAEHCAAGELCCADPNLCSRTLSCMSVSACPPLSERPCMAPDAGGTREGGPAPTDASGSNLKWYYTCGDPVCTVLPGDAGPAVNSDGGACPAKGTACTAKGQTCGTASPNRNCGAVLVCDDHNPAVVCPV